MKKQLRIGTRIVEQWEYGALQIHNPNTSTLKKYFELVSASEDIDGDLVEFGVYRGASLCTTGLILENIKSQKRIYGFDTFTGFPHFSPEDNFENFRQLHEERKISNSHFEKVKLNFLYLSNQKRDLSSRSISTSGDFSATSLELVAQKIQFLGLNNRVGIRQVDLCSLDNSSLPPKISIALLDVDLFSAYKHLLPIIWQSLSSRGIIYLDEYFSLKFPGPRIAVDEFCSIINIAPTFLGNWMDFERWALIKP